MVKMPSTNRRSMYLPVLREAFAAGVTSRCAVAGHHPGCSIRILRALRHGPNNDQQQCFACSRQQHHLEDGRLPTSNRQCSLKDSSLLQAALERGNSRRPKKKFIHPKEPPIYMTAGFRLLRYYYLRNSLCLVQTSDDNKSGHVPMPIAEGKAT